MCLLALILLFIFAFPVAAKSLAGSIGLFVYPAKEQDKQQREQDDYRYYAWVKDETNYDPMNAREPAEVVAQKDSFKKAMTLCLEARGYSVK